MKQWWGIWGSGRQQVGERMVENNSEDESQLAFLLLAANNILTKHKTLIASL